MKWKKQGRGRAFVPAKHKPRAHPKTRKIYKKREVVEAEPVEEKNEMDVVLDLLDEVEEERVDPLQDLTTIKPVLKQLYRQRPEDTEFQFNNAMFFTQFVDRDPTREENELLLAKLLGRHPYIRSIEMARSGLSDIFAEALAKEMFAGSMENVESIDLEHNAFSAASVELLLQAAHRMEKCLCLSVLKLSGQRGSSPEVEAAAFSLVEYNDNITKLTLDFKRQIDKQNMSRLLSKNVESLRQEKRREQAAAKKEAAQQGTEESVPEASEDRPVLQTKILSSTMDKESKAGTPASPARKRRRVKRTEAFGAQNAVQLDYVEEFKTLIHNLKFGDPFFWKVEFNSDLFFSRFAFTSAERQTHELELANRCGNHIHMRHLDLSGAFLSDVFAMSLADSLEQGNMRCLEALYLQDNRFTPAGVSAILKAASDSDMNPFLNKIDVSNQYFTGVAAEDTALETVQLNENLRELGITYSTPKVQAAIEDFVAKNAGSYVEKEVKMAPVKPTKNKFRAKPKKLLTRHEIFHGPIIEKAPRDSDSDTDTDTEEETEPVVETTPETPVLKEAVEESSPVELAPEAAPEEEPVDAKEPDEPSIRASASSVESVTASLSQRKDSSDTSSQVSNGTPGPKASTKKTERKWKFKQKQAAKPKKKPEIVRSCSSVGDETREPEAGSTEFYLRWATENTKGYPGIGPDGVDNFSKDWKSGLAFCALIHRFRPDVLNYAYCTFDVSSKENRKKNLDMADTCAVEKLKIPDTFNTSDIVNSPFPPSDVVAGRVRQYHVALGNLDATGVIPTEREIKYAQDDKVDYTKKSKKAQAARMFEVTERQNEVLDKPNLQNLKSMDPVFEYIEGLGKSVTRYEFCNCTFLVPFRLKDATRKTTERRLAEAIGKLGKLKVLHCNGSALGDDFALAIAALSKDKKLKRLEEVSLEFNVFTAAGVESLISVFGDKEVFPKLAAVRLANQKDLKSVDVDLVLKTIESNPSITKFNVDLLRSNDSTNVNRALTRNADKKRKALHEKKLSKQVSRGENLDKFDRDEKGNITAIYSDKIDLSTSAGDKLSGTLKKTAGLFEKESTGPDEVDVTILRKSLDPVYNLLMDQRDLKPKKRITSFAFNNCPFFTQFASLNDDKCVSNMVDLAQCISSCGFLQDVECVRSHLSDTFAVELAKRIEEGKMKDLVRLNLECNQFTGQGTIALLRAVRQRELVPNLTTVLLNHQRQASTEAESEALATIKGNYNITKLSLGFTIAAIQSDCNRLLTKNVSISKKNSPKPQPKKLGGHLSKGTSK